MVVPVAGFRASGAKVEELASNVQLLGVPVPGDPAGGHR
jgi:hypothetical protein